MLEKHNSKCYYALDIEEKVALFLVWVWSPANWEWSYKPKTKFDFKIYIASAK